MTLAAAGAAFLNAAMKQAAGVTVTYVPKGGFFPESKPLTAWTGTAGQDETVTATGTSAAKLVNRERDYLIVLADLFEISGGTLPKEGDRITETIGGTEQAFEVCKRDGEPCWRFSDRERTRIRVHTRPVNKAGV